MIYLSGAVRPNLIGLRPDLGVLLTPQMRNHPDLSAGPWAADNGCFTLGERFDMAVFLTFLAKRRYAVDTCLFAPAPDVVGDAAATLRRSAKPLEQIRAAGYRAALVAQDGLQAPPWDAFDALFIGGTTAFKLSHEARELTAAARDRAKWVHMGRVNSERRLRTAAMWGCQSVDGTFLAVAPDENEPRLLGWLDNLNRQPELDFSNNESRHETEV